MSSDRHRRDPAIGVVKTERLTLAELTECIEAPGAETANASRARRRLWWLAIMAITCAVGLAAGTMTFFVLREEGRAAERGSSAQTVSVAPSAAEPDRSSTTAPSVAVERNAEDPQPPQEGEEVERPVRAEVRTPGDRRGRPEEQSGPPSPGQAREGTFDSSRVVRELRLRQPAIRRCYERELRTRPTLGGRIVARFTIQPSGSISDAMATENTTGSAAVEECVLRIVRGLRFTPGPEGGAVSYSFPFVFAVQD